jgi:regulator of RNase E activity RraA
VSPEPRAAQVADALDAVGLRRQCMSGMTPLVPASHALGPALTFACAPVRGGSGDRYAGLLAAIDAVERGHVVVVASGPSEQAAVWGELVATLCLARGAAGAVTDGLVRDSVQLAALGFPVFARGTSPYDMDGRLDVVGHGVAVTVGGVDVLPGDTVVADRDGVAVIPQMRASEVLDRAVAKARSESEFRSAVAGGMSATDAFRRFDVL